jgi:hypothetical protein
MSKFKMKYSQKDREDNIRITLNAGSFVKSEISTDSPRKNPILFWQKTNNQILNIVSKLKYKKKDLKTEVKNLRMRLDELVCLLDKNQNFTRLLKKENHRLRMALLTDEKRNSFIKLKLNIY